jgi:hypothetical protein
LESQFIQNEIRAKTNGSDFFVGNLEDFTGAGHTVVTVDEFIAGQGE